MNPFIVVCHQKEKEKRKNTNKGKLQIGSILTYNFHKHILLQSFPAFTVSHFLCESC